jgi:dihydroxy-acid dehydratase
LAKDIKTGVWKEDLVGLNFYTIGVRVTVCQMVLMRFHLVSRDVIADSIETVVGAAMV